MYVVTNVAAAGNKMYRRMFFTGLPSQHVCYRKRVTLLVELDNMKSELQTYKKPLVEVRDSL